MDNRITTDDAVSGRLDEEPYAERTFAIAPALADADRALFDLLKGSDPEWFDPIVGLALGVAPQRIGAWRRRGWTDALILLVLTQASDLGRAGQAVRLDDPSRTPVPVRIADVFVGGRSRLLVFDDVHAAFPTGLRHGAWELPPAATAVASRPTRRTIDGLLRPGPDGAVVEWIASRRLAEVTALRELAARIHRAWGTPYLALLVVDRFPLELGRVEFAPGACETLLTVGGSVTGIRADETLEVADVDDGDDVALDLLIAPGGAFAHRPRAIA